MLLLGTHSARSLSSEDTASIHIPSGSDQTFYPISQLIRLIYPWDSAVVVRSAIADPNPTLNLGFF